MRKTLCLLIALHGGTALGAHKIEQTITGTRAGKAFSASHTWVVERGKFTMQVKSSLGSALYLFNGRVFYVCSALNPSQISYLKTYKITNADLVKKFKNGACQVVPANFLARFFLSPVAAVESIDQTDGLKVTVGVEDYDFKTAGKSGNCQEASRSYTITKKTDQTAAKQTVAEKFCMSPSVDWRKNLWREVAKTILRQPGGSKLMQVLRNDHRRVTGYFIRQSATISNKQGDKTTDYTYTLSTKSEEKVKISKKQFSIPKGYEVIHPDSISGQITPATAKLPSQTKEDSGAAAILLCAISGSFFCIGN